MFSLRQRCCQGQWLAIHLWEEKKTQLNTWTAMHGTLCNNTKVANIQPLCHSYILCYINAVKWFMNWIHLNTFTSAKGETAAKLAVMGHDTLTVQIWRHWHWRFNGAHVFLIPENTGCDALADKVPRCCRSFASIRYCDKGWPVNVINNTGHCVRKRERDRERTKGDVKCPNAATPAVCRPSLCDSTNQVRHFSIEI